MRNELYDSLSTNISWLQSILNSSPAAVMIGDPYLNVIKWNTALEQLLPYKEDTPGGKNLVDLLHQLCCDKCGISERVQQIVREGSFEEDITLIRPDGSLLQLSCYSHKWPDTDRLSAIVIVIKDLQRQVLPTPYRIRREYKNNLTEPVFYSYLENSLAPAWVTDEEGYVLFMNKLARQTWGLDESYRHKHLEGLFSKQLSDEFLATDSSVLKTGQPISFVSKGIGSDGSTGFYLVNKFLLPLPTTKRLIAGQAIDITTEINAQEELKKSNERFSYVAKAVSDCIWDWNIETGEIYRSEALMTLTGYKNEDIKGSLNWWIEKVHPEDRRETKNRIDNFIKKGHSYCDIAYRFRCADNSYRYFIDKGYIIYQNEKPVRAIGIVHDITEKKEIAARLLRQKIQKEKEIEQAIITAQDYVCDELGKELHDNVNQVLSTVMLLLSTSQNEKCENKRECIDKSQQYVKLAIEEIRKISKSLNSSRIQDIGLIKLVEEIIANLELSLPLSIQFECDPALEQQLSTKQKLMIYRIIQEQTNNIAKYALASEVSISIKSEKASFCLEIHDNGKGFDLKEITKGNGLANIRNRVEAFYGSLNIITFPGKGCCIKASIPFQKI